MDQKNQTPKWYDKPLTQKIILAVLPVLTGTGTFYVSNDPTAKIRNVCILVMTAVILIINITFVIHYTKLTAKTDELSINIKNETKAYRKLITQLRNFLTVDSAKLAAVAHHINENNEIQAEHMVLSGSYNPLCRTIYEIISCFSEDSRPSLEVTYVKRINPRQVMTVGVWNDSGVDPYVLNQPRNIDDPDAYFDARQFRQEGKPDYYLLCGKDVYQHLIRARGASSEDKYKQYIPVAVMCERGKMVGLVQIAALDHMQIPCDHIVQQHIVEDYLRTIAHFILLKYKVETIEEAFNSHRNIFDNRETVENDIDDQTQENHQTQEYRETLAQSGTKVQLRKSMLPN